MLLSDRVDEEQVLILDRFSKQYYILEIAFILASDLNPENWIRDGLWWRDCNDLDGLLDMLWMDWAEMRRNHPNKPDRKEYFGLPHEETSDNDDRSVQELIKDFCNAVIDAEKEEKEISENETCIFLDMTCNTIGLRPNAKKGKAKDKGLPYPDYMLGVEHNSSKPKDFNQVVPKAIIVECMLEGIQVRALLDTGSLSDFISTTIIDQIKLEVAHLSKPTVCQMATSGSRTMITTCVDADLQF